MERRRPTSGTIILNADLIGSRNVPNNPFVDLAEIRIENGIMKGRVSMRKGSMEIWKKS